MIHTAEELTPLVSVIVPAFNAAPFIERTLQSVRQQTYSNLEIIIINDGSTDDTPAIIEKIAQEDERVRTFSVRNGGVARARNIGIAAARADFVAFIDADDLWHPTKIALQVACLQQEGPDVAACYVAHRSIDLADRVSYSGPAEMANGYIFARHLYAHFIGNGSSLLVRRNIANAVGGYEPAYADAGIGGCEDLDFECKIAARYRMVGIPSYLVGYRRYEGNMSSDRRRMARAMVATVRRHLAANPMLPWHARRYALAAAYDYCVWTGLRSANVGGALTAAMHLLILDPGRCLSLVSTLSRRLLESCGVARRRDSSDFARGERPHFYDLSPDMPPGRQIRSKRRRIKLLEATDEGLWQCLSRGSAG